MSTVWTNTSVNDTDWNSPNVVYLATEGGEILETENSADIILENDFTVDWSTPTTNRTIWT